MKVGIIAPSSVPFRVGGAENFWWGMLHSINQDTQHQADLIKVPSRESNFWELLDNYRYFFELDVRHFDLVISTKYPAWMIQHHNHVCYIQHKLRGLYDTYPDSFAKEYVTDNREITKLQGFMRSNQGRREALKEFFPWIDLLRSRQDYLPKDAFNFPGPLIREIVHFLDGIGLAPSVIKKYCAIADNVVKRQDYFPTGVEVETIHHPPIREDFYNNGKSDYLFTVSRLEQGSKRIDLLIAAMKYVKADIKFKIGGTGSDLPYLKQLAGDDRRIEFIGFVNDRDLLKYYADAFAILYIPYDEDYGLITIEAMMSGKPVITTTDAGGPNEFVVNGETGYSVPLDPKAIAERIDYLCTHPDKAKYMGATAQKKVQEINWKNTVTKLLSGTTSASSRKQYRKVKKITVALTFPIFPPVGGGPSRIYHLYRHLARKFDIELVSFTWKNEPFQGEIAPGLWETRIPMSAKHLEAEKAIRESSGIHHISDVVMPRLYNLTPAYVEALKTAAADSDFLIASHPYLFPALRAVSDLPIWYEAHNIELKMKQDMFPNHDAGRELLRATSGVENDSCQLSQLVMVCSDNDATGLRELYDIEISKCVEVPNGVDLETVNYVSWEQRQLNQQQVGIAHEFLALFMGSWHHPNVEAVGHIFKIARQLPDVKFIILGNLAEAFPCYTPPDDDEAFLQDTHHLSTSEFLDVCFDSYLNREIDPEGKQYWQGQIDNGFITRKNFIVQIRNSEEFINKTSNHEKPPVNVNFMGLVDDPTKDSVLGIVDVALNPMVSGSGTNLKMLDYLAAGVPVVSTPFGARGLGIEPNKHCLLAEIDQFDQAILQVKNEDANLTRQRVKNAREYVAKKFDWAVIAENFLDYLEAKQITK